MEKVGVRSQQNPGHQYTALDKDSKCSAVCGMALNSLFSVLTLNNFLNYLLFVFHWWIMNPPVLALCVQCCAADCPWHGRVWLASSSGLTLSLLPFSIASENSSILMLRLITCLSAPSLHSIKYRLTIPAVLQVSLLSCYNFFPCSLAGNCLSSLPITHNTTLCYTCHGFPFLPISTGWFKSLIFVLKALVSLSHSAVWSLLLPCSSNGSSLFSALFSYFIYLCRTSSTLYI